MLLNAIYNTPLLNIPKRDDPDELAVGFVDDSSLVAFGETFKITYAILRNMMERKDGAFAWSRVYNSPLEPTKFALVNFSKSSAKLAEAGSLILTPDRSNRDDTLIIQPSPHAKLLGVILDSKLTFGPQHNRVVEKAFHWTSLFKRFNHTSSGISLESARRIYIAVAEPKVAYGSPLWFETPHKGDGDKKTKGSVAVSKKLESLQRQAAISITGAMKSSPGDATIAHANITPIRIKLSELNSKAALRVATFPPTHPLHAEANDAKENQVTTHKSALHRLFQDDTLRVSKYETIETGRQPTAIIPGVTLRIDERDKALEWEETEHNTEVKIYTDGSGYEGNIGASAVLFNGGKKEGELRFHLGTDKEHTIYEGELVGIILANHLLQQHRSIPPDTHFRLDNTTLTPLCPKCNAESETVEHVLFKCQSYAAKRSVLTTKLGRSAYSKKDLLNTPEALPALFDFLHSTSRFAQTFGDLSS